MICGVFNQENYNSLLVLILFSATVQWEKYMCKNKKCLAPYQILVAS